MAKKEKPYAQPLISEFGGLDRNPAKWSTTHGMYIAGRAYADEADFTASQMEQKWGCGRLRLLVAADLRERFDRQRYLYNQALWHGDLEDVRRESGRIVKAWMALDRAAEAAGAGWTLSPLVWEVVLSDGTVAALVRDNADAKAVQAEGRAVKVYTTEEIARLLDGFPTLAAIKTQFPGASVTSTPLSVPDPLDGVHDTSLALDDAIPF